MSAAPRVLLVEDDFFLRDALRLLLEASGYDVAEAASGEEALVSAAMRTPAVVVLDLGLPDRSGLDVARELRTNPTLRDTPIIALTGRSGEAQRQACLEAGCTEHHAKPLSPSKLIERIKALLADRG